MTNIRTVSDTKRDFYTHHNRPINSIYRQVVEEILVEMHLLSVNADFKPDPIYCLGVVTAFNCFLQGYQPEQDQDSIFSALCQAVGATPDYYRQEAERMGSLPEDWTAEKFVQWLEESTPIEVNPTLFETIQEIKNNSSFKYSRLFGIGLYTLLEKIEPDCLKETEARNQRLERVAKSLGFSAEKIQKDLDLYRSNLEKMEQVLLLLKETIEADRKKRQERQTEQSETSTSDNQPSDESV